MLVDPITRQTYDFCTPIASDRIIELDPYSIEFRGMKIFIFLAPNLFNKNHHLSLLLLKSRLQLLAKALKYAIISPNTPNYDANSQ